ncbi:DoxX family protein [Pedobacter terrae]|uniref:DoxX family protein n=1 Tax=Pedobacter terrae TaxID=405671 RepID=UPI002FF5D46A
MSFFNHVFVSWNRTNKFTLRFFFIFILLLYIPLDYKFYVDLLKGSAGEKGFYALFKIASYPPNSYGHNIYLNGALFVAVAVLGSFLWDKICRKQPQDFDKLYYWLRVIVRYRLALAAIAYGLIKVFPLQMPYPSLSNLHTNYGDFLPWKIYFHTTAIAPPFEAFLGSVELIAGLLLLYRKTVVFGAGILAGYYGNVFASNTAYQMGYTVFSLQLAFFAVALFIYDGPRLYRLLVTQKYTVANTYHPRFGKREKLFRTIVRPIILVFVLTLSYATYHNFNTAPYKYPKTAGLKGSYGYFNVKVFKFNNVELPYSTTDLNRWQNVVFEKWATLSIKTAKPIVIDEGFGDQFTDLDADRNFESAGVGGRRYFAYQADTLSTTIQLVNKNPHHKTEHFDLSYQWLNDSTIVLSGINEHRDSIYAELNRINKKYLLFEGRRKPIKL